MKVLIVPDPEAVAERAAGIVARALRDEPRLVLGLATGETMRPFYARLAAMCRAGELSFRDATTFNLDEFVGIPPEHPASFTAYMRETFFDHVDLPAERAHLPKGDAPDPVAEAGRYEAAIAAAGGIGLQVLGIGQNGHVAFNEPTSSLASRTRVKTLTVATRKANAARFTDGDVPLLALTMGLGTILEAKETLLLATGASKAAAVARAVEGPLGADCPATILQMHPAATVIVDEAAAGEFRMRDYYDTVHPGGGGSLLD